MFLILMSSITLCSENQNPVFKEGRSNTIEVWFFVLFVCAGKVGGGGSMRRSQTLEIIVFSVKKQLQKALRSVQFLASFTSFYFEVLSYFACGEKIIRLASKQIA